MSWVVVRGAYHEGKVELLEKVPSHHGSEVLVLFPAIVTRPKKQSVWRKVKQRIGQESPELLAMTATERQRDFDALSQMIAEQIPYRSVEEFEQAVRGDQYDLAGH